MSCNGYDKCGRCSKCGAIEKVAVGISAYMTDLKTGQIVWSNSCSKADEDIDSAASKVVKCILKTLPMPVKL